MRKHWIDNLRWATILLVLFYHVIYFYNNKGVFGGVGGFGGSQPQDVVMYILYPWFMPLLFLLAGMSARYALEKHSGKEWFGARTRKLLVPATIGLFVFHWMTGYFNTRLGGADALAEMPGVAKYFIWAFSGTGPLWFVLDLWIFSLLLLLLRKIDKSDRLYALCGRLSGKRYGIVVVVLLGLLLWAGEYTMIQQPRPDAADGLYNLHKPLFYVIPFLMGYYLFAHDGVVEILRRYWMALMGCAVVAGIALIATTFGDNPTSPQYLTSPLNNIYGWLMCLALIGWFKACFDATNRFATYMTRSSFGLYVVHYVVVVSFGFMMKYYTTLPPVAMYLILTVAVFTISPLLYETIRRIPVVRWCVLGMK